MECNNGQVGFGRRRREITPNQDENKLFEVSMSTLFQIKFLQDDSEESKKNNFYIFTKLFYYYLE